MKNKEIVWYTAWVYDLFHVWHVNILKRAKSMCDRLIIWVSVDDLVKYKWKQPVIPFEERIRVVEACKYVDAVVPQDSMDKMDAYNRYKFDVMFVWDDWYKTDKWKNFEEELKNVWVKIVYFPYTKWTSSTIINETLNRLRDERNEQK